VLERSRRDLRLLVTSFTKIRDCFFDVYGFAPWIEPDAAQPFVLKRYWGAAFVHGLSFVHAKPVFRKTPVGRAGLVPADGKKILPSSKSRAGSQYIKSRFY